MSLVFVGGATGYTGREVVKQLCARGIPTVAHVRPDSSRVGEFSAIFEPMGAQVDVTPWQPEAIRETFLRLKPSCVFALLGTTRARGRKARSGAVADTYEAVDLGLTLQLLDAAQVVQPAPRFVYLSSLGAERPGGNAYLQVRAKVEQRLTLGTVPYTIVRPSFITGDDREEARPLEKWSAALLTGTLNGLAKVGFPYPRDQFGALTGAQLAEGMVNAALDPSYLQRVVETHQLRPLIRSLS